MKNKLGIKSVVAIDPGKNGGICVVSDKLRILYLEQWNSEPEEIQRQLKLVRDFTDLLFLESAISMTTNRTVCNKLFYQNGYIVGYAEALGFRVVSCSPRHWKNVMQLTSDKQLSISKAKEIYSNADKYFSKFPKKGLDGIAEALLLAYYGYSYFMHYPEDGNIKVLYTITYANDLKYKDKTN